MFRLLRLKPPHGWGAVAWELLIVTLGVLIALGAQQLIETASWREKVASAKHSIDFEINDQLDYAEEAAGYAPCAGPFIDTLEAAILRHDRTAIAKLHDTRPPFQGHPESLKFLRSVNGVEQACTAQVFVASGGLHQLVDAD